MRYAIAKALNLIIINSAKQGFLSPSLAQVIEYFQVIGLATREDVGWNAPSVSAVFQALFIGSSPVVLCGPDMDPGFVDGHRGVVDDGKCDDGRRQSAAFPACLHEVIMAHTTRSCTTLPDRSRPTRAGPTCMPWDQRVKRVRAIALYSDQQTCTPSTRVRANRMLRMREHAYACVHVRARLCTCVHVCARAACMPRRSSSRWWTYSSSPSSKPHIHRSHQMISACLSPKRSLYQFSSPVSGRGCGVPVCWASLPLRACAVVFLVQTLWFEPDPNTRDQTARVSPRGDVITLFLKVCFFLPGPAGNHSTARAMRMLTHMHLR